MAFFDDLALGSQFHRAFCADTQLRIEPIDNSPNGRIGFQMIVEGVKRAAGETGDGLKIIKKSDGTYQSVVIHLKRPHRIA